MREHDKKTEKEFPARLKIHPFEAEKDEIINRGRLIPKTEKEQPPPAACQQQAQKRKFRLQKLKMRGVFWLFSLLYFGVASIPVYLAWAERFTFKHGLSGGSKVLLTVVMVLLAAFCIRSAWQILKRGEEGII